jgi:hypothetical protein
MLSSTVVASEISHLFDNRAVFYVPQDRLVSGVMQLARPTLLQYASYCFHSDIQAGLTLMLQRNDPFSS